MSSDKSEKRSKDPQNDTPAAGSSTGAASNSQKIEVEKDSDDQSDSKSSTGSGETTCSSWRTRSDRWTKSRRPVKSSTSTGKKDFFGKRNKKWLMSGRKNKSEPAPIEADSPPNGAAVNCVCTMYRKTSTEEPGPSNAVPNNNPNNTNQNNGRPSYANICISLFYHNCKY